MSVLVLVALVALVALLFMQLYRQAYERPPNFPPGPPRLPLWGSYWFLLLQNYKFMHKATMAMAKRYKTRLLGVYLGQFPAVVAMSYDDVRSVLTRTEFAGRPDIVHVRARAFGERLGVLFSDGPFWQEQKRFTLRHLRDMGFGRRFPASEAALQEQVEELLALARGQWADEEAMRDGCMRLPTAIYPLFINLFWTMMAGRRFGREEYGAVRALAAAAFAFIKSIDQMGGAVAQTPWLLRVLPEPTGLPRLVRSSKLLSDATKKAFEEHNTTYSEDHMRDFIDRYIREMRKEGKDKQASFTEEQLQLVGTDMLLATATTTTSVVSFAARALMHHPELQRRCQEQLDAVVGRGRLPTLDDRPQLTYVEAILRETMRLNTILPMALPHQAMEDTQLGGYDIPKNTLVFCNLWAYHNDKELWGDPEVFRPERFLDENKCLKRDITLPFGTGKRLCPGETFSRQGLFVLLAALLQNFTLQAKDPFNLPPIEQIDTGIGVSPEHMWVKLIPRD